MNNDIEFIISNILKAKGKKFLTVTQIRNFLPIKTLKQYKLTKKSSPSKILNVLEPLLGDSLKTFKGPRSLYIGFNITSENMILDFIKTSPGISTKQLGNKLPMLKKEYLSELNMLIRKKIVCCTVNDLHNPKLELYKDQKKGILQEDTSENADDSDYNQDAFKSAYDKIGKGRNFVRIHQIREYLNWPDLQFDKVLEQLMADYIVELHGGDPGSLTQEQIENSYTDNKGILYITLTWWGNK